MLLISFPDAVLRKAQKMIDIMMRGRDGETEERLPWKRERKAMNHPEEMSGRVKAACRVCG